jgi:hypothetical protein
MECRDCEDWLWKGINSLRQLVDAETLMRNADSEGLLDFDDELRGGLDAIYRVWLGTCAGADKWIESLNSRGLVPDNINEYRKSCEEAKSIVESRQWTNIARTARVTNSSKESW